MISVSIPINGEPIMARSALNQGKQRQGKTVYLVDDGSEVLHDREDGAVALAAVRLPKSHVVSRSKRRCSILPNNWLGRLHGQRSFVPPMNPICLNGRQQTALWASLSDRKRAFVEDEIGAIQRTRVFPVVAG